MFYEMNLQAPYQYSYPQPINNPFHDDKALCDYRMTIHGRGTVSAKPDIVSVVLGVVTEGGELKTIQQENATKMTAVINALKKMGINEKDIATQSYDIETIYDYVEGRQIFRGYRVRNIVKVNIRYIQKVGEIIDNAVVNGANFVGNFRFTLQDPSPFYRMALNLAIKEAIENAISTERTLNIEVDKTPVEIVEEKSSYIPLDSAPMVKSFSAATPVETGLAEIIADIKAVFVYKKL